VSDIKELPSFFFIGTLGVLVLYVFFIALQRLPSLGERFVRKLSRDFNFNLPNNFLDGWPVCYIFAYV